MREYEFDNLSPLFISGGYIDNLVCDGVIEFFKEDNYFEVLRGNTSNGIDLSKKDSFDKSISVMTRDERIRKYLISLNQVLTLYTNKYTYANKTKKWEILEDINIQFYNPGGGYKIFHCERDGSLRSISRHLAFMTYLNDVTDGGETEWLYQNLKVKPQKGLTLIWPCDWTHTHRGIPSLSQEKIIVTGWYNFSE